MVKKAFNEFGVYLKKTQQSHFEIAEFGDDEALGYSFKLNEEDDATGPYMYGEVVYTDYMVSVSMFVNLAHVTPRLEQKFYAHLNQKNCMPYEGSVSLLAGDTAGERGLMWQIVNRTWDGVYLAPKHVDRKIKDMEQWLGETVLELFQIMQTKTK